MSLTCFSLLSPTRTRFAFNFWMRAQRSIHVGFHFIVNEAKVTEMAHLSLAAFRTYFDRSCKQLLMDPRSSETRDVGGVVQEHRNLLLIVSEGVAFGDATAVLELRYGTVRTQGTSLVPRYSKYVQYLVYSTAVLQYLLHNPPVTQAKSRLFLLVQFPRKNFWRPLRNFTHHAVTPTITKHKGLVHAVTHIF